MNFIKEMLSDSGSISCMRVMSIVSMFAGTGIAIVGIYKGQDLSKLAILVSVFVGAAFGGKAIQAFADK
jgi:hypothetical protein